MLLTKQAKQELRREIIDELYDSIAEENSKLEAKLQKSINTQNETISILSEEITSLTLKYETALSKVSTIVKELERYQAEEKERIRKRTEEPFAEIISNERDEQGKLKVAIDWNEHFIQDLIKRGIRGTSEEEIVAQWLDNILHNFTGTIPVKGDN